MEGIAHALAWPIVAFVLALASLFLFRREIGGLLHAMVQLSVAGVLQIRFAEPVALSFDGFDIRREVPSQLAKSSTVPSIIETISYRRPATYVVIGLGGGNAWLTSRLYILIVLLRQYRDLKMVVFTHDDPKADTYVGWAEAERIIAAFQNQFPYLMEAYSNALHEVERRPYGAPSDPALWIRYYLSALRSHEKPKRRIGETWVQMTKDDIRTGEASNIQDGEEEVEEIVWERAVWVTPASLNAVIGKLPSYAQRLH